MTRFVSEIKPKLAEALRAAGRPEVPVSLSIDTASLAKVRATLGALPPATVGVRANVDQASFARADAAAALRRSFGLFGAIGALNRMHVPLFGGVGPAALASVGALHLAIDGVTEALAVVVPAVVGLGIYSAAAAGPVQDLYTHLKNVNTVSTATGQAIYPLTGGLQRLQAAAKPSVYQMFGDALSVAAAKGGALEAVVRGTGTALDQLAARATVALKTGGASTLLANFRQDILGIGTTVGNLFGVIGNVLRVVPGYAQTLLHVAEDASGALERLTGTTVVQGILRAGLAFHGLFIYGGLAATVLGKGVAAGLGSVGRLALPAAVRLERMGAGGALASRSLLSLGGAAEEAAALPWGWIAAAGAGLALFTYRLITAKDATQQWVAGMQTALGKTSAASPGSLKLASDQVLITRQLAQAQRQLASATKALPQQTVVQGTGRFLEIYQTQYTAATTKVNDLTAAQRQFSAESALYSQRLGQLARQYGGTAAAQGLLAASGIKMSDFLSRNQEKWLAVQQQVQGTLLAYRAAGQQGGILGADMLILDQQASDQYQAISQLNSAWQTFIGNATGLQSGELGAVQALGQLSKDWNAAHASFTGANAASITLQQAMVAQITTVQGVANSLRQAHAPAHAFAQIIGTDLAGAVKHGALENKGFRNEIYDLAKEAGYAGPDKIKPLTKFIDGNATSLRNAIKLAEKYAGALAKLPSSETVKITTIYATRGTPPSGLTLTNPTPHALGTPSAAAGWALVGEAGPELIRLRGGEPIIPIGADYGGTAAALAGAGGSAHGAAPAAPVSGPVFNAFFDGLTGPLIEAKVRNAFQAMSIQQGQQLRLGRRS